LMERVRAATIDRDYRKKQEGLTPSDHTPVVIEVDEAGRP
jgi:exonuclease III